MGPRKGVGRKGSKFESKIEKVEEEAADSPQGIPQLTESGSAKAKLEWTTEQDSALLAAVDAVPSDLPRKERWKAIANQVKGHGKSDCNARYYEMRAIKKEKKRQQKAALSGSDSPRSSAQVIPFNGAEEHVDENDEKSETKNRADKEEKEGEAAVSKKEKKMRGRKGTAEEVESCPAAPKKKEGAVTPKKEKRKKKRRKAMGAAEAAKEYGEGKDDTPMTTEKKRRLFGFGRRKKKTQVDEADATEQKTADSADTATETQDNKASSEKVGKENGRELENAKVGTSEEVEGPPKENAVWTAEQDAALLAAVDAVSSDLPKKERWKAISSFVEGHGKSDCNARYFETKATKKKEKKRQEPSLGAPQKLQKQRPFTPEPAKNSDLLTPTRPRSTTDSTRPLSSEPVMDGQPPSPWESEMKPVKRRKKRKEDRLAEQRQIVDGDSQPFEITIESPLKNALGAIRVGSTEQLTGKPLLLGFLAPHQLMTIVSMRSLYWWPLEQANGADPNTRTVACIGEEGVKIKTVTPDDFDGEWYTNPQVREPLAAGAAIMHIQKFGLHAVCRDFIRSNPKHVPQLALEDQGLSKQFFVDFFKEFKIPANTRLIVVLHIMRFLSAGTNRSFAELMQGQSDKNGRPYVAPVDLFLSYSNECLLTEAVDVIYRASAQRNCSCFIDAFAKNQQAGGRTDEGQVQALEGVIRRAQMTLLVLSPWHNPRATSRCVSLLCLVTFCLTRSRTEVQPSQPPYQSQALRT
jgi:hypothetical protein